ncbi:MnmC family methyltransferase [uncultured Roseibium sp.]|uniref:MnmC family methyltransferase n=1 Tax=uncultured Roseibium sp. TaxID=1936171 RepID=UPI00374A265E
MWEEDLLKSAFDVTTEGGTFATYTAAGWVRRNLASAGFTVEKQKGFAGKREMVAGWKG